MATVLVADDVPDVRELISLTLSPGPYTILEATDGNAAWTLIQKHQPEVVVLDVLMPGRSGLEPRPSGAIRRWPPPTSSCSPPPPSRRR